MRAGNGFLCFSEFTGGGGVRGGCINLAKETVAATLCVNAEGTVNITQSGGDVA